ncbi:hypothetical protein [Nocardia arthritidis]|uniref:Uncharacterized protein n=1 Tax=Nocardia arthritidis TaxID=228602 RepID=A0A6G9YL45_9NOCA|nr:hypothetical protein [Nocardia arthritidis]QIS13932.1 hypothetical protein F5544_30445 [Nocardia arthritidis]
MYSDQAAEDGLSWLPHRMLRRATSILRRRAHNTSSEGPLNELAGGTDWAAAQTAHLRADASLLYTQLAKGTTLTPRDAAPFNLGPSEQIDVRVVLGVAHSYIAGDDWEGHCSADIACTDQRLLLRSCADGHVVDFYWDLVDRLEIDLDGNTVVIGFDIEEPILLYGPAAPILAVYAVWRLRSLDDFLNDPDLSLLR